MSKVVPIKPPVPSSKPSDNKNALPAFSDDVIREAHRVHEYRIEALREAQALYNRALMHSTLISAKIPILKAEKYIHGVRSGFGFLVRIKRDLTQRQKEALRARDYLSVPIANPNQIVMSVFTLDQRQEYDRMWLETAMQKSKVMGVLLDRFGDPSNIDTYLILGPQKSKMPLLNSLLDDRIKTVHDLM